MGEWMDGWVGKRIRRRRIYGKKGAKQVMKQKKKMIKRSNSTGHDQHVKRDLVCSSGVCWTAVTLAGRVKMIR